MSVSSVMLCAASGGGSAGDQFGRQLSGSFDDEECARQLQDAESGYGVIVESGDVGAFVSHTAEGLKEAFSGRMAVMQSQIDDLQEQVSA